MLILASPGSLSVSLFLSLFLFFFSFFSYVSSLLALFQLTAGGSLPVGLPFPFRRPWSEVPPRCATPPCQLKTFEFKPHSVQIMARPAPTCWLKKDPWATAARAGRGSLSTGASWGELGGLLGRSWRDLGAQEDPNGSPRRPQNDSKTYFF